MLAGQSSLSRLLAFGATFCLLAACGYDGVKSPAIEDQPEIRVQKEALTEATFFKNGISRGKVYLKLATEVNGPVPTMSYGLYAIHKPGTNKEISIRLCSVRDAQDAQYASQIRNVVEQASGAFMVRANEIPEVQAQAPGAYLVVLQRPYLSTDAKLRERERARLFAEAVVISIPGEQNVRTCSFLIDANQLKSAMRPHIRAVGPSGNNQGAATQEQKKYPSLEDIARDPKLSE